MSNTWQNGSSCLIVLFLVNGCLYLPVSAPETQNVPETTELETLVEKPLNDVLGIVGEPIQIFIEDDKKHHFYLETQEFGLLIIGGPGYAVGGTLNEIYHCYQLTYDKYNTLRSVAVGEKGLRLYRSKTDCRKSFWTTEQIELFDKQSAQLREVLKAKAQAGDRSAAFELALEYHDTSEIELRANNGDRDAIILLIEIFAEDSYKDELVLFDARHGDAEAQFNLYFNLNRTFPESAHQWLCKSADQGYARACFRLAANYENGTKYIETDYVKAYMWYVLGVQSGGSWGKDHSGRVKTEYLSPESFAAAREAIRTWQPGQCEVDLGVQEKDEY